MSLNGWGLSVLVLSVQHSRKRSPGPNEKAVAGPTFGHEKLMTKSGSLNRARRFDRGQTFPPVPSSMLFLRQLRTSAAHRKQSWGRLSREPRSKRIGEVLAARYNNIRLQGLSYPPFTQLYPSASGPSTPSRVVMTQRFATQRVNHHPVSGAKLPRRAAKGQNPFSWNPSPAEGSAGFGLIIPTRNC